MCGLVGVHSYRDVRFKIYDALSLLQHRGQDAAGIITADRGSFNIRRGSGLVNNVFNNTHMERLDGNMGLGHVRYPTAGGASSEHNQPFYVNSPYGIALGHNGNLVNAEELRQLVIEKDKRHLNTDSDSEVLLNVLAHELQHSGRDNLQVEDVFNAVSQLHKRCIGGYACVAMVANYGLLGFRDPNGIRPLIFGKREKQIDGAIKTDYMLASESVALTAQGFDIINDVAPGEVIFIDRAAVVHRKVCAENTRLMPCIFEHVYLSRPDSIMDEVSVYMARLRQGKTLAAKILNDWSQQILDDIDIIVPVPDTSRVACQSLSEILGVGLREGLMKNRYVGRTFIMPDQTERKKSVRQKLSPIKHVIENKSVLLVDDSIVRGTTAKEIVEMVRSAGARNVYLASAAPKVLFPNVYGIDMADKTDFVAYGKTDQQIADHFNADKVIYQDLSDLEACSRKGNKSIVQFETSVFDGNYRVGHIDEEYLNKLASSRGNSAKQKQRAQLKIHQMDDE